MMEQEEKCQDYHRDKFPKVILSVSGGVADVIFKPTGIAVIIFDYDVEGVDKHAKDPDGENCIINNWPLQDRVIGDKHWPIIRQAMHDATCRGVREWKCPDCGLVVKCSYDQLVDVGNPVCSDCDIDMTMI